MPQTQTHTKMSSEAEDSEQSSGPKLALLSLPPMRSKSAEQFNNFGMVTPPHHSASVPFRWEEEPGKPRPCKPKALSLAPFKGLDLPPRLQFESKFTKTPSPTTVLEGPYVGRSIFHSLRIKRNRGGSFDGGESGGSSPERSSLGLSRRWLLQRKDHKDEGFFDESLRRRRKKKEVVDEGSFVISCEGVETKVEEEVTRVHQTRKKSLLGLAKTRSNFWATSGGPRGGLEGAAAPASPGKPPDL